MRLEFIVKGSIGICILNSYFLLYQLNKKYNAFSTYLARNVSDVQVAIMIFMIHVIHYSEVKVA